MKSTGTLNSRQILSWALLTWFALALLNFVIRPPEFYQVYPSLVRLLAEGGILWQMPEGFLISLLRTLISFALCLLPGWFFISCLRLKTPLPVKLSLAFIIGWGVLCLPLEILAIFHRLTFWWIVAVYLVVTALGYCLSRKYQKPVSHEGDVERSLHPEDFTGRLFWWASVVLIGIITVLSFYHALLYPVTYWDSLILYTHFGEITYQEGGFPVRVCAQVGLGLGGNYPHFYPLSSASIATIWGQWSDIYAQFFPPFAGLLSLFFIYYLLRGLFGNRLTAMLGTLVFRSLAYPLCYYIWASDYGIIMLLSSAVCWLCFRALQTDNGIPLIAAALITGIAWHINYLGGIFLVPILTAVALFPKKNRFKTALVVSAVAGFFAAPWYIRNIIVTGNPVYAFFPEIFGGKYIDLDVLASCAHEWASNGDGVVRLGESLWERIVRTPGTFLFATNWHWKFGPVLFGLAVPGIVVFMFSLIRNNRHRVKRFSIVASSLLLAGLFYEYVISGLYLYHVLFLTPVIALFSAITIDYIRGSRGTRPFIASLILVVGLLPGLALALAGPKLMSFGLTAFRYPGLEQQEFWGIRYPDDAGMWRFINSEIPENAGIITHENRYHVFRRDIRFHHLDDWVFSRLYGQPFSKVRALMKEKGIGYYLYIPNEQNHPITAQLGISKHLDTDFRLLFTSGKLKLYALREEK